MKPFDEMNIVDRAKLFADLFPSIIPAFLTSQKKAAQEICDNPAAVIANWHNDKFPASLWVGTAEKILDILKRYEKKMPGHSSLFADQLFDGINSFFTIDCLQQFIKLGSDIPFSVKRAVDFFF